MSIPQKDRLASAFSAALCCDVKDLQETLCKAYGKLLDDTIPSFARFSPSDNTVLSEMLYQVAISEHLYDESTMVRISSPPPPFEQCESVPQVLKSLELEVDFIDYGTCVKVGSKEWQCLLAALFCTLRRGVYYGEYINVSKSVLQVCEKAVFDSQDEFYSQVITVLRACSEIDDV